MGLFNWLFSDNDSDDYDYDDLDPDLLYQVGEHWLSEAVESDDDVTDYRWDATEYIEAESGGGFWSWLTGG